MNKTLRWKKTIGVLAIILGGLRFLTGIDTLSKLDAMEKLISGSTSLASEELRNYISSATGLLISEMFLLMLMLILGITLLSVDKGLTDEMPREKSKRICGAIFVVSIIYLFMEIIACGTMPSEIRNEISPFTFIGSFGFLGVLIVFCVLGLGRDKKEVNAQTNTTATKPAPLSPLDTEIEQLKKNIEKLKLQKELAQLNAEKQAEIEQLKKELANLKQDQNH